MNAFQMLVNAYAKCNITVCASIALGFEFDVSQPSRSGFNILGKIINFDYFVSVAGLLFQKTTVRSITLLRVIPRALNSMYHNPIGQV